MNTFHRAFTALGSAIAFTIVVDRPASMAEQLLSRMQRDVLLFEKRCSRFISGSELSQLNTNAGVRTWITPELHDILARAREISIQTNDLFNPFVLPALQRAGYTRSFLADYQDDSGVDVTERAVAKPENMILGQDWAEIPYGSAIDLGGCGKGYIGDLLAGALDVSGAVRSYWLSIGGDVIARGLHENGEPMTIGIKGTKYGENPVAYVDVPADKHIAVATSTTVKRRGRSKGRDWHHIIDPRTGRPADTDILLASVVSESLFCADVHASNCIIVGSAGLEAYAVQQQLNSVLVERSDHECIVIGSAVVAVGQRVPDRIS